jgi:predicted transcriptional regulator YdeE
MHIPSFSVIGISVRTTNESGQSQKDIGELWGQFLSNYVADIVPNRISDDIYCIYTDYSGHANGYYTTILGCKVGSLEEIPDDLIGKTIPEANYEVRISKGKLPGCVVDTWSEIWNSDIKRQYSADFDVYGAKALDPENAEVETYISVMD